MSAATEELQAPSLGLLLLETRAVAELAAYYAATPVLCRAPKGDGHPVIVMPGMGASDSSTRPLRRYLHNLGYDAHGWGVGRNIGAHDLLHPLAVHLRKLSARHGRKVSLIGWSLGGLFARELAKREPSLVRQVITLGSPFKGPSTASNVWRLYELLSGHKAHDESMSRQLAEPPPVPTTAIYTRGDGIVAWQRCVERPGSKRESIEVRGSHHGLGHNPVALYAIADRLAQPEDRWTPFRRAGLRRALYPDPHRKET